MAALLDVELPGIGHVLEKARPLQNSRNNHRNP